MSCTSGPGLVNFRLSKPRVGKSRPDVHSLANSGRDEELKRKLVGRKEFTTVLRNPDSMTAQLLSAWSNIPLLLMRDLDWERAPLVLIGLEDYMMSPLLPPGTLLQLNKKARTIAVGHLERV